MRKRFLGLLAVAAAGALALSGCGGGSSAGGGGGSASSGGGKVGVILPDAQTSPRWESADRPALKAAFDAAGLQSDIQNANGDKAQFGTICDSMIAGGVNVIMIVNLDSETGTACIK